MPFNIIHISVTLQHILMYVSNNIPKLSSKTLQVWNAYKFMKREGENGKSLLFDFHKVQECVAKVTGLSHSSMRRIVEEGQQLVYIVYPDADTGTSFSTLLNRHHTHKPITGLDDFDKGVIRIQIRIFTLKKSVSQR